jgi:hypothetical protein
VGRAMPAHALVAHESLHNMLSLTLLGLWATKQATLSGSPGSSMGLGRQTILTPMSVRISPIGRACSPHGELLRHHCIKSYAERHLPKN